MEANTAGVQVQGYPVFSHAYAPLLIE